MAHHMTEMKQFLELNKKIDELKNEMHKVKCRIIGDAPTLQYRLALIKNMRDALDMQVTELDIMTEVFSKEEE